MPAGTVVQFLVLLITLGILFFSWWTNKDAAKQKERDATEKEISDAVASGDISRINAIIQRLRS